MKTKFNKLIAALVAVSALTTSMVGFGASATDVTTPETEIIVDEYVQYQTYNFKLDKTNVGTSDDSMTITKTTNESDFKISYGACSVGQASVKVEINGVSQGSYTIPSSTGVGIQHNFSCNAGDKIKLTITPASGYVKAQGSITIYW